MHDLNPEYLSQLETIVAELQASDEYATYLDSEEEADYKALQERFEPAIEAVHEQVAAEHPLQLEAFELVLTNELFEGLFLPRALGYAVLRGEVDDQFKYTRQQEHFKHLLQTITTSPNFEWLRRRIGQTVQVGFMLSSDIWVTSLINEEENRKVRNFLNQQRLSKFRHLHERRTAYERYEPQFRKFNYLSMVFPEDATEMIVYFDNTMRFLKYRIAKGLDNSSLVAPFAEMLADTQFHGMRQHVQLMGVYANFFPLDEDQLAELSSLMNQQRRQVADFGEYYFAFLRDMYHSRLSVDAAADRRLSRIVDRELADQMSDYYNMMDQLHSKGYVHDEVGEAAREFTLRYDGLAPINACLRQAVLQYAARFVRGLEAEDYSDFIEMSKTFTVYIQAFDNEAFNLDLRELYLGYLNELLATYTDKRGRDYQDIKRFFTRTLTELKFLPEKEAKALFVTKRKKKSA